jgi:hypothetical protein
MSLNSMYFKQMIRPQCILKMMTSILNILCKIKYESGCPKMSE